MWLIDLTRAFIGTELESLDRARALSEYPGDAQVEVTVLSIRIGSFNCPPEVAVIPIDQPVNSETAITNAVVAEALRLRKTAAGPLHVLTYRPSVRESLQALSRTDTGLSVAPIPRAAEAAQAWSEDFMPVTEAVEHLVAAVHAAGGGPIRKTDLRAFLKQQSPKFDKANGGPAASPRFVSILMREGVKAGAVKSESVGGDDTNPFVSLDQPVKPTRREPPPNNSDSSPESMSDSYITTLRQANLGPFQEVRTSIYERMDTLLECDDQSATHLVRHATAQVREDLGEHLNRGGRPFPWSRARIFIISLLNRSGVLLGDDGPIWHSFSDSHLTVRGLKEQWTFLMDAELILELLRRGLEIHQANIADLAGALYNGRRDDDMDKAIELLSFMIRIGLIEEDQDQPGAVRIAASQTEPTKL